MGLNIRIYNIVSDGSYVIRYKSGSNPYPVETDSSFTTVGTYNTTVDTVTIENLEFDTQYWIKMTDVTTGRYIVKNIYVNDSKAFPCYDTMCFDVDVTCESEPDPSPTPTNTVTPTVTPTSTPAVTPSNTPTVTPTPSSSPEVATLYYRVIDVVNSAGCVTGDNALYVTFDNTNPAFLGFTPIINDYVTLLGAGYAGCWKVLSQVSATATSTTITGINYGNCDCLT